MNSPGLQALGYIGVASSSLDEWGNFGSGLLGLQLADKSRKTMTFRMDDRRQRIMVNDDERGFFGWEVADAAALDGIVRRLEEAKIPHEPLTRSLCTQRFVRDGVALLDPVGNRLEIFYGAETTDDPFVPGRNISGFRTGAQGLGHAVLTAPNLDPLLHFYGQVLGFQLSDYLLKPFKAYFFHLNTRHHSLAMVEAPFVGIHHLMVEMMMLDDVGQAYDLALRDEDRIGVTLGRHTNDQMTSFYAKSPSKFLVECGWGGRSINPETWQPFELMDGPSLWGHDRFWLPDDSRAAAEQQRIAAAERGSRAPVHVQPGNYEVADVSASCTWWAGLKPSGTAGDPNV